MNNLAKIRKNEPDIQDKTIEEVKTICALTLGTNHYILLNKNKLKCIHT